MNLATQKDIQGDLRESLYLYKSAYNELEIEDSLNFLTQLIYVSLESIPVMGRYNFSRHEIDTELAPFLDPFYFDYCIDKFGHHTNEFEFWRLFFFEALTGGTQYKGVEYKYTKERLLSIISKKPDELVAYFPFNAFNVEGILSADEHQIITTKIKALIEWVKDEPLTRRIKTIGGYLDYDEPLVDK